MVDASEIRALDKLFKDADKVCIASHRNPDGDAVGSCLALKHFLRQAYGKASDVILENGIPGSVSFLDSESTIITFESNPEGVARAVSDCDLLCCLDVNGLDRTGKLMSLLQGVKVPKVLIDHHPDPKAEEFDLVFSRTDVSSACEMLYLILMALPETGGSAGNLPAESVEALMTGLTTDTNNFGNSVFPTTLGTASELIAAGAPREDILRHIYNEHSENRIRLFGYLMSEKLEILPHGVACVILDNATRERFGVPDSELEGLVNIPLDIKEVCLSLLLREDGDQWRISLRSKKGVSANSMAKTYFNGGGHEQASGGKVLPENAKGMAEVEKYVKDCVRKFFEER